MASSETGHGINSSNLDTMVKVCIGLGTGYNPSNPLLQITSLTALNTSAAAVIKKLSDAESAWKKALGEREIIFKPLKPLVTRVIKALKTSEVPEPIIDNAITLQKKLQGTRASSLDEPEPPADGAAAGDTSLHHSASQLSFDNRILNMAKLVSLLAVQPMYMPNETDLTVAALTELQTNMNTSNEAVKDAVRPIENARAERDKIFYTEKTGLVDVALLVKTYIQSAFGTKSPQYKQVSKLKFTRLSQD